MAANRGGRTSWHVVGVSLAALVVAGCSSASDTRDAAQSPAVPGSSSTGSTQSPSSGRPSASATGTKPQDPWLGKADVSVFLCIDVDPPTGGCAGGEATDSQRDEIRAELERLPEVAAVFYESSDEAYRRFKSQDSMLADSVTPDQMPDSYRVKLKDPSRFSTGLAMLQGRPGVSQVVQIKPR